MHLLSLDYFTDFFFFQFKVNFFYLFSYTDLYYFVYVETVVAHKLSLYFFYNWINIYINNEWVNKLRTEQEKKLSALKAKKLRTYRFQSWRNQAKWLMNITAKKQLCLMLPCPVRYFTLTIMQVFSFLCIKRYLFQECCAISPKCFIVFQCLRT